MKSPRISDGIKIDSLSLNDTYIGTLTDTSSFNQQANLANIYMRINTSEKETFKIDGKLDLKEKDLDLSVKMDDTELAVLTPFVSDLVSNLKGHISSDLTVKGPFSAPKINGDINLNEAQVMVNYLKTTYKITDKVHVENSIIQINNLDLKDIGGNTATANGTVDLNQINTPTLDITIKARTFMALNTTAKDNQLWPGFRNRDIYLQGAYK
jgi:autotransporter translocation and assembly factor TamB